MLALMAEVWRIPTPTGALFVEPPRERAIAALAEAQHTVVSLEQFEALHLGASGVRARVSAGRLRRIHRGVYAVGPGRLGGCGEWMAAVLACGPSAVLSHRSAAALWGLRADRRDRADVSVPGPGGRSRPGIQIHRSSTLRVADVTVHEGIPITTVARTLLDLAEAIDQRGLERAIEQAEVLRLFDGGAVDDLLARSNGRRGCGRLRLALAAAAEPAIAASELEERFLALCLRHRLPRPEVNVWIETEDGPLKVDFLWRRQRLVVETDGYGFHRSRGSFERDHRRDGLLSLSGWRVQRFTWRQVTREEEQTVRTVRAALR